MRTATIATAMAAAAVFGGGAAGADPPTHHDPDQTWTTPCKVADVSVFPDRIHVLCAPSGQAVPAGYYPTTATPIHYFATEVGDPIADKAVTIATAAWAANRVVIVQYADNPAKNPVGCRTDDCRRLISLRILPY